LSLDPARYRERFCTKRFVGFKPTQNCLLGQSLTKSIPASLMSCDE